MHVFVKRYGFHGISLKYVGLSPPIAIGEARTAPLLHNFADDHNFLSIFQSLLQFDHFFN
jgi:hypothetical protein